MSRFIIYKYEVAPGLQPTALELPIAAKFLHAGEQREALMVWYELPLLVESYYLARIYVVPTGIVFDIEAVFLATVQMKNGLVWHLYEKS